MGRQQGRGACRLCCALEAIVIETICARGLATGRNIRARAGHARDQAGAALEREVVPEPAHRDDQAVAKADQEVDVRDAPQQPGEEAGELERARSARPRACGRSSPASRSRDSGTAATSCRRRAPSASRADDIALAASRPARRRAAACRRSSSASATSPITKISGCPGTDRSGPTFTRPARSLSTPSHSAAGDAFTPAAQMMVRVSMRSAPIETPPQSHIRDAGAEPDLHAELFERVPRRLRQRRDRTAPAAAGPPRPG